MSVSDGYNFANNYQNGFKVAQIDGASFEVANQYTVGINPGQLAIDNSGNVFVVCRGNYGNVPSKVVEISADGTLHEVGPGSIIAINNQNRTSRALGNSSVLYVLNVQTVYSSDYKSWTNTINSYKYNSLTRERIAEGFLDVNNLPINPTGIMDVNPSTGDLYICSDASTDNNAYTTEGKIYIYSADGVFKKAITTGVHPYGVVFK